MKTKKSILLMALLCAINMWATMPTDISQYTSQGIVKVFSNDDNMDIPMTYLAFENGTASWPMNCVKFYAPSGQCFVLNSSDLTDSSISDNGKFLSYMTQKNGYTFIDLQSKESGTWHLKLVQEYAGNWAYCHVSQEAGAIKSGSCGTNVSWSLNLNEYTLIISGSGAMTNYSNVKETPWYSYRSYIHSVVIKSGVTTIGSHSFDCFYELSSVSIPEGLTFIGWGALAETSIQSLNLPSSLREIEQDALIRCKSLKSLSLPEGFTTIANGLIYNCPSLEFIDIPSTVTSIGNDFLGYCKGLKYIICRAQIPPSISNWAALNGVDLSIPIYVPKGKIESYTSKSIWDCFTNYNEIQNALTSNYVGQCGANLIWELNPNTGILSITGFGDMYDYKNIEDLSWYEYRELIRQVIVYKGVTSIGSHAFDMYPNLISVTIPNSLQKIGWGAFAATPITNMILPNSIQTIEQDAFLNCTNLKSIKMEEGFTTIPNGMIYGCSSLEFIDIPSSVTTIGDDFLGQCTNLEYIKCHATTPPTISTWAALTNVDTSIPVYIPEGTTNLYRNATVWNKFSNYIEMETQDTIGICGTNDVTWLYDSNSKILTILGIGSMENYSYTNAAPWNIYANEILKIVLSDGITSIGDYAFYECSKITKIIIPNKVSKIGEHAFDGCRHLTSIVFGDAIEEIGEYAFYACTRVNDMTCYPTVTPDVFDNALTSINSIAYLFVQVGATRTYQLDNNWNRFGIHEIGAEKTIILNNQVQIVPKENEADLLWPKNINADNYSVQITKGGVVICTLAFSANGQLTNIAFAPLRKNASVVQTTEQDGFLFTVSGLSSGVLYNYAIVAKNNNEVIECFTGTFLTTGEEQIVNDIQNTINESKFANTHKVITHNGLYLIRDGKIYNTQGMVVE